MVCQTHPSVTAAASCDGCAEPFCKNCLVSVGDRRYCSGCKTMAVAPDVTQRVTCQEANEALKMAVLSIFCFGIFVAPLAIQKALKARAQIAADPSLRGEGEATFALVLATCVLLLNVLGFLSKITKL